MRVTSSTKRILLYSSLAGFSVVLVFSARIIEYNHANFTVAGLRDGLSEAVRADDLFAMRVFLMLGVDPNKRPLGSWEQSLLIVSIKNGSVPATKLLLDHGTYPNGAIDVEGTEFAPALMDRATAGYLRAHVPFLDALDDPLAQAALRREKEIFDLLRARGAPYGIVAAIAMNDGSFARSVLEQNKSEAKRS